MKIDCRWFLDFKALPNDDVLYGEKWKTAKNTILSRENSRNLVDFEVKSLSISEEQKPQKWISIEVLKDWVITWIYRDISFCVEGFLLYQIM